MRDNYGSTCLCKTDRNRIEKLLDNQEIIDHQELLDNQDYMDSKTNLKQKNSKGVACLVLGIIGQFVWLIPLFGFPIGFIGLTISIKGLIDNESKVLPLIGLILSSLCVVITSIMFILLILVYARNHPNSPF